VRARPAWDPCLLSTVYQFGVRHEGSSKFRPRSARSDNTQRGGALASLPADAAADAAASRAAALLRRTRILTLASHNVSTPASGASPHQCHEHRFCRQGDGAGRRHISRQDASAPLARFARAPSTALRASVTLIGEANEPTIAGGRDRRGREHDGGETPPSQPPRRQRSTCVVFWTAGAHAGWQCAVSAHWGGRVAGVCSAGGPRPTRTTRLESWLSLCTASATSNILAKPVTRTR
jgi:hypothetical protein